MEVDHELVLHLIRALDRTDVTVEELTRIGPSAADDGQMYRPVADDLIMLIGAFWVLPTMIERLVLLKRQGVRVGILIHDVIPITHPEFCERGHNAVFGNYFYSVLKVADIVLSISEHTQSEVKRLLDAAGIHPPEMFVLRNAHAIWDPRKIRLRPPFPDIRQLLAKPYVLYVSTIEVRKNHTLLFRIWKRLKEEARGDVPQLVFVGRAGWRVRDLMDQIEGTDYLDGHITILHDISDNDLAHLYRSSRFTTFTSFEEGWGLPVGESLIFGRPCIATHGSSIPEVGGELVDYVNPYDLNSSYAVFHRMIYDDDYRLSRTEQIRRDFKIRTWDEVAGELNEKLGRIIAGWDKSESPPLIEPVLEQGRVHHLGHRDNRAQYMSEGIGSVVHFLFDASWYAVENFGRWMANGEGSLSFMTTSKADTPVRLTIGLSTVGWFGNQPLQVTVNDTPFEPFVPAPGRHQSVTMRVTPVEGRITIAFNLRGKIQAGHDPRRDLSVGITTLSYAAEDDLLARIALLEGALSPASGNVRVEPRSFARR